MSPEETRFLFEMDTIWRIEEAWRTTGIYMRPFGQDIRMQPSMFVPLLEDMLRKAGRIIGLNTRFRVDMYYTPKSVTITPKNGAAHRMMRHYQDLYMERELVSECGS